jgi:hypothetical protein
MIDTINQFGQPTLGVLGIRGYARPVGQDLWVDLGIVDSWEQSDEIEELEIDGARSGLREVYEVIPISASLGYTFNSKNANDEHILALHNGAAMTTDGDGGFSAPITFGGTNCELIWVRENAQPAKPSTIIYHPAATIRRDGTAGTPGEEAAMLSFSVTVTSVEGFTVPAAVNPATPAARYGYQHVVPTEDLDTWLGVISAPLGS